MLLSEEIQILSLSFSFLAMSKFSRVRFRLFVAWNVHSVGVFFLPCFCSLVIFIQLMLVVCMVSRDCNHSSSAFCNVVFESLYRCIDALLNYGKSSSSFFSWHIQSVMSFLVFWFICLSFSLVLMRFLLYNLVSCSFFVLLRYSFLIFSFTSTYLILSFSFYLFILFF